MAQLEITLADRLAACALRRADAVVECHDKTFTNLTIVAAVGLGGEIGWDRDLPWDRIAADWRRFRRLTAGGVLVMGRLTWNSIPEVKMGRTRIVMTRGGYMSSYPCLRRAGDLTHVCWRYRDEALFAVGGVEIFRWALPLASTFHLTRVLECNPKADKHFPTWPFPAAGDGWRLTDAKSPKQVFGEPAIIRETYRK